MVNWIAEWKAGVGPVMKVMKFDGDDPMAVANTAYSRFYFNSEASNLSYVFSHFQLPQALNTTSYPNGFHGLQTGSLSDQWVMRTNAGATPTQYEIFGLIGRMPDIAGTIPFAEVKFISGDGTARILWNNKMSGTSGYIFSVTNYGVTCYSTETGSTGLAYRRIPPEFGYTGWCIRPSDQSAGFSTYLAGDQDYVNTMIWDLPCNNVPIPKPSGTPISGQLAFAVEPGRAKMARPGFSVDTATGRQLIMDSDRTPIKCVMMGETPAIAPGTSYFVAKPASIDFDLSQSMVCDTICNLNGWGFAIPPVNLNLGTGAEQTWAYYKVEPNGITFSVVGSHSVAIRFMLYATGLQGHTSGGNQVMRRLGNEHFQIKRPGSSDAAPGYNDILVDTRFSAVTVLADGYIPTSSFSAANQVHWRYGNIAARINFDSQGMFVFPKVIVDFGDMYRQGNHAMRINPDGGGIGEVMRQSMATVVNNDHCIVHISPGNYSGATGFPDPVGVRYFILGAATL
ncbi:hypothetical protein [Ochrobactrum chromiisoli]|uniref:Tail fiber protein n=1 Tax=Ochrobactrum chromiisoli TaxID=2993941 RepID=A0ABT3QMA9_9HYPH|nr:hypothetical protein [Ochrobactrum chromiisoli]MCX2696730.1 hypothetical protein [Ochrobactrum chromiisoli]